MTERFFTNAITASGGVVGNERIPYDLPAGGSEFLTTDQIVDYAEPIIIAATEDDLLAQRGATGKYSSDSSAAGFTATAAQIALPANVATAPALVVLDLTGALAAGANLQLPTVSAVQTVVGEDFTGQTWMLRIINNSSGAFAWTLTTNTGWTLNGTMSIAQNTFRDFLVTISDAAAHTASLQNVGSGGN